MYKVRSVLPNLKDELANRSASRSIIQNFQLKFSWEITHERHTGFLTRMHALHMHITWSQDIGPGSIPGTDRMNCSD